ncbi:DUF7660 family protein [Sphingobacterium thalpophilum]|uniref:DUF7660 domain-containing protein n=1 Tax=Sphingobacterium thalpophilum TaxID=259 RepID=A0A4U9VVC2_9SPHI|nr:hypothetical protein [Sphingobacterium thalpophilum]VTR51490.1 Uncharacterised protein [Sphingobacterium thalpophilum]
MVNQLYELKVTDRMSFIKFLDLLHQDLLEQPETWENKTLSDFLEALAAYTKDIQGYYDNTDANVDAEKAAWSTFADIFKGAKIYE